ncbi:hypothetical protein R3P38DRAFT_2891747 [Favolaschia claudopus]|uniref:Uncharacterized protein n=1 Tax=Favolaschia claudopus TaxID=2862362 RepID=A0AAW0CUP5_9AGAR
MAPSEYFLRLQHGIKGGFAPTDPDAVFTVTQALNQNTLAITAARREDGTPGLQDAAPKSLDHSDDTSTLVDELHGILKTIPMEDPKGSEDIYGLNTSIIGTSMVKPTEEDKAKFKRAVEIVNTLVNKAG